MKLAYYLFIFNLFFRVIIVAQTDSVMVASDTLIKDGIFINYFDFRHNKAIYKDQIVSPINKEKLDFIGKTLDERVLTYKINGRVDSVATKLIWGFFQNKTLYINYKGSFYRVPVFGAISYLVATVEVASTGFYDPMFGPGMGTNSKRKEIREFYLNFYNGLVTEFKMKEVELLLSKDQELYAAFKKLSNRKQREQISHYIRMYNQSHPIYFLNS